MSEMDAIRMKIQQHLMEMNIQEQNEEKALIGTLAGNDHNMQVQRAMKWDRLRAAYQMQMAIELQKAEERWNKAEGEKVLNPGVWHTADGKPVTRKTFAP